MKCNEIKYNLIKVKIKWRVDAPFTDLKGPA